MALTRTRNDNGDIVIMSGDRLTIESAAEFQRLLAEGLEGAQTVALEFEEGVQLDITGIQLLCSACKSAAAVGKNFVCHGPCPPALDELIQALGAQRHAACKQNLDSNCVWFGGGE